MWIQKCVLAFEDGLSLSSDDSKHVGSLTKYAYDIHYEQHGDDDRYKADTDYDTICNENMLDDSRVKFTTCVSYK